MKTPEKFEPHLQTIQSDIRFEVILADLISENLDLDDVVIESNSLFKRNYHFDVESTGEMEYGAGKKKKLRFIVNREGLYDQLPEDLFHQVAETKNIADKDEAIQEIKEHHDIEKNIRRFFQPIEHEFYNQRIGLELEERKFLFETNHVLPGEIFNGFWDLPEFLDDLQKSKLGLLMPVINKLVGKRNLLPFIFESITGDHVEIRESMPEKQFIQDSPVLGSMELSTDSILGGILTDQRHACTFAIYIDDVIKLPDYMPGGNKIILYEFLCSLFMPLDSEIIFETAFSTPASSFILDNDMIFQGRLHFNTII